MKSAWIRRHGHGCRASVASVKATAPIASEVSRHGSASALQPK